MRKKEGIDMSADTKTFFVGSVTNAMRGKELLEKNGMRAYVGRAEATRDTGCGYTLTVTGDTEAAVRLLEAAGIRARRQG